MTLVTADRATAATRFHARPFTIRHGLADHPLFTLPRLIELARSMPRDKVEYSSGDVAVGQNPNAIPKLDMAADEVIARIEHHNAWMVLKRVETDPAYGDLLKTFVSEVFDLAGPGSGRFSDLQGFIFVSSANATTPFHIDAEENILVQIRGDKFVHVFDNDDRSLISEEEMEISPSKHRNQAYDASFEDRAEVFSLHEGDGVHIPYMAPHWVRTGNRYSVSMAMTWKTPRVERLNKIRLMNGTLRHFGLPQRPPGSFPVADSAKVLAHDAMRAVIDPLRRSEAMRRTLRGLIYGRKANYYYETGDERG